MKYQSRKHKIDKVRKQKQNNSQTVNFTRK